MTTTSKSGGSFFRELKRRKVLRTSIYYLVLSWVVLQVGGVVLPALGVNGEQASRVLLMLALLGFPIMLIVTWYFQLTPRGVVRTTSFVERRVLRNMAPVNDRRHAAASNALQHGEEEKQYRWIISAVTGPLTGLSYGIAEAVELGRSLDCAIAVVSPQVSPQHARLEVVGDELIVEDLGSAKGTVVNGKTIEGRHVLHHEDELRLHDIIFRVTETYVGSPQASPDDEQP